MLIQSARELVAHKADVAAAARLRLPAEWFRSDGSERLELVFDLQMHLAFLGEAVRLQEPRLFTEYAIWTSHLLQTAGGNPERIQACFDAIGVRLGESCEGEWVRTALQILAAAREAVLHAPPPTATYFEDGNAHKALSQAFLDACLHMQRSKALSTIQQAVDQGVPLPVIYVDVITPAMRELGRLWHLSQVTVGQEHYCTAVAQMVMAQLFPAIFDGGRISKGCVVSACVAGELHEIGARMVADMFEMNGWDTIFLGADVPRQSVIDVIVENRADVLAISTTLGANLGHASDLIDAVRAEPACNGVKVMVGGAAFGVDPQLWKRVGADGWAPDAPAALVLVNQWRS
ncbi:MAG: cobalamin-dependent protein [Betaproteobacteria bacterium]|nr:cobalamin-dependent protein [Betaproteobacteria bacterium]